jgi:hypothetical protein
MSFSLGLGMGLTRRGGGGAASFDFSFAASGYTGMRRWHDADNLSGDIGSNVSRFANTAPGLPIASDYVQATTDKQLVLAAEGGHQYLLSTETLRVTNMETDPAYANLVGTHMFALVRPDTGAPQNEQMLFGEASVNLQVGIQQAFVNPTIRVARFPSSIWSNVFSGISITLPTNKWFVIESKLLASGTSYVAINGTTIATTTNTQDTSVTARLLMAMDVGIRPFHGGLQTMVLYDTDVGVSTEQRTAILAELAARSTAMS